VQKEERVLNPTVVKLGIISFLADVASEMLYPVTPIFLTTVLGASMAHVGLIEGVAEAIASLMKTYSGFWSDKINKRKPFILLGYFLGAISKPLIGISTAWSGVLGARAIDRTGKGLRSAPRDALLADSVSAQKRGEAFGWHRMMDTLGAATGPLLAILILNYNAEQLRPLYFWAVIPGLLSVIVILTLKDKPHKTESKKWLSSLHTWNQFGSPFKTYLLAWGIFSLANSSDVFLLMKAKEAGFSTQNVILLFCFYNLTYALSSPWLGRWSDKIGKQKILILGLLIFSLVYMAFGISKTPWHFWILFLIYGLYMGATDGVGKALAVDLCPENLKATGIGILGTVTGVSTVFASVAAGLLWDNVASTAPFVFGAAGAVIAILLLIRIPSR
jgi:MFS family permease